MKKKVSYILLIAVACQPLFAFANPYTTNGSANALKVNNQSGQQAFSVSLGGAPATPSYTLATGQASAAAGKVATPISCDLAGFAANFDSQTAIANMGQGLQNFVKDSAQTWAVNKSLDFAAEQYATAQCASKTATLATKAEALTMEKDDPKIIADINIEVAKATATAAAAPKMVGTPGGPIPDAQSIASSGIAMGEATVIANTAAQLHQAAYMKNLTDLQKQCEKDAKDQFMQYVTSSMQILNGEFWNQITLDAQQCALEKQMANDSPSKALFNFVKNDSNKKLDLGIFTVRVGKGGADQIEISKSSDTQAFKEKETGARTDVLVDASNTVASNVLFNQRELDRWNKFKADWDNAIATGASKSAIDDVFKAHPVNPARTSDARYADYWISKVYYTNIDNAAQVELEQLQANNAKVGKAAASASGITQMQMMTELRQMREQALLQTKLLAQMVSQRNDAGGGSGVQGGGVLSNADITGAGVGATALASEGKDIKGKVDSSTKNLLDITLE